MNRQSLPWAEALADRYSVERELGQGGMAIVYLARDRRYDRLIALKVLRPELGAALGRDRFLREIQVTARLQHPHILPVFDSGEAAGQLWYAMPFVDGETLRARMSREGRIPVGVAIQLAREVASALAYAHETGVVHRDIKPENILLSRQGQALVADFGIAKALDAEALTETGFALGTPVYMAPEQLLGERPVRPQADVYALGVVLYEMLAGSRPFSDTAPAAMLAKRLTEGSPLVSVQRPDVPAGIALLIRETLEVDPALRPATGSALAERLHESSGHTPPASTMTARGAPAPRSRRRIAGAVVAIAALVGAYFLVPRITSGEDASIGVLPFENRSGDSTQAYLSEGVTDELTARLSSVPQLKVSPRSSTIRFRASKDAPEAIARKLGVRYLLTGSVSRQGDSLRVSVELVDAPAGRQKWSEARVSPTRALAIVVDSVARSVVHALAPSVVDSQARRGPGTADSMAYDYYLLAQHHWNRFTEPELMVSLAYADSAIARDPAFVGAWLVRASNLLALASGNGRLTGRAALGPLRQALDTVVALDPQNGQAHAIRGQVYTWFEWDWNAADREFRQAYALDPGNSLTYVRMGFLQGVLGHTDSALALLRHAERLEPTSARAVTAQALSAYFGRRYEETMALSLRALALDPYFPPALQYQVLGLSALGRHADAITVGRQAAASQVPILASSLAIALAQGDSTPAARVIADTLAARATRAGAGAGPVYRAYAAIGDRERTFAWLDRAIAERSFNVAYLYVDPVLDAYRSDPRFKAATARAGLPPP